LCSVTGFSQLVEDYAGEEYAGWQKKKRVVVVVKKKPIQRNAYTSYRWS
jgi:hypothetical protein